MPRYHTYTYIGSVLAHKSTTDITSPSTTSQSYAQPGPSLLKLADQQVGNHLSPGNEGCAPKGIEVQRAAEGIGIPEEEHGRNPAASVLERKASFGHLVLLDLATL